MSKSHRKTSPPRTAKPPAIQPAAAPKWHLDLIVWIALILSVLAVYSQVGHFDFITYDDPDYVTNNAHVQAGLTPANIQWALTAVVGANWAPVTILSHMAICNFFGLRSGAHHWVNVVLHALSAVLLFAALRRATRALWPSAFVAFVFALHPLHVESVAWISELKDVLSTFFWFLALYAYLRYTERPSPRRYLLIIAPFCLGLMAKPMLVTFPFTLLLLDVWPLRRAQFPRTLWEKVPLFAISLLSSVVTYFVQRSNGAVQTVRQGESVLNALVSYVSYIGQTFWPIGLTVFYPRRTSLTVFDAACAFALILAVSLLAVFAWRTRPYFAAGWFWYLGTLVPVIGLVQVGRQSHADRYMYVPMIGLSIILAWGAADVVRKWPQAKFAIASLSVASCLACLGVASAQAAYWRNTESVFRRAINVTDNNFIAQYNLADYLADTGRLPEAATHFEEALRIKPDSADAHNKLGGYLMSTGHIAEGIAHFEAALRSEPHNAEAHFNLGVVFSKTPGREPEAIAHYQAALAANPQLTRAHKNLALLLLQLEDTSKDKSRPLPH